MSSSSEMLGLAKNMILVVVGFVMSIFVLLFISDLLDLDVSAVFLIFFFFVFAALILISYREFS